MASKRAAKTPSKAKSSTAKSAAAAIASKAIGAITGIKSKSSSGKRRRKHSTSWYVKERARLKAKRAYERERLRI